jgi:hypothetical protein
MKKGLIHFIFLLTILFTNASYGQWVKQVNAVYGFNAAANNILAITKSDNVSSNSNLVDLTDDDLSETERKIILVQKPNLNSNTNFLYLIKLVRINKYFSKIYFFQLRASLFLLIKVFRL